MQVNAQQKRWNEKYDLIVEYKQQHGHCNVHQGYIINGQKLRSWVNDQRRFYKKGKLPEDRADRLNEIGFNWSMHDVSWEEQFKQLVEFKGEHGHFHVPLRYHDKRYLDNPSLGGWVDEQRKRYRGSSGKKLLKDRIDRLNGIGFTWEPHRGYASHDAAIDGQGTLIEGTEAPIAKSTTRGTNETNDEGEPPEHPDSQKSATKRNASS